MEKFLLIVIFSGILALVHPKIVLEKFESRANPEYVVLEHREKEVDGVQMVDVDCWIKKGIAAPLYTTTIFYKQGDDYEQIIVLGPLDPCNTELYGAYTVKHSQEFSKYGNMSLDYICPFTEGYTYIRDFKVDFLSEELPSNIPLGQYKMTLVANSNENGVDVKVLDEDFYLRLE